MQKIVAVSDIAIHRISVLFVDDVKRGLMVGVALAVAFMWGP